MWSRCPWLFQRRKFRQFVKLNYCIQYWRRNFLMQHECEIQQTCNRIPLDKLTRKNCPQRLKIGYTKLMKVFFVLFHLQLLLNSMKNNLTLFYIPDLYHAASFCVVFLMTLLGSATKCWVVPTVTMLLARRLCLLNRWQDWRRRAHNGEWQLPISC